MRSRYVYEPFTCPTRPRRCRRSPGTRHGFPAIVRSQSLTPLKIGIIPVDVAANAFYAQDLGLFTKAGFAVEFQVMASGPVLAQAVAGGAIDFGISNVATIGNARLKGLPFRFVAAGAVVNPGRSRRTSSWSRKIQRLRPARP